MIIIGIGANLPSTFGTPYQTCLEAIKRIENGPCELVSTADWYKASPVPAGSTTPWYINSAIAVKTELQPNELMAFLHDIETDLGRIRDRINDPRNIDLDIIDYNGEIRSSKVILPHPRMHLRGFVLFPLKDLATNWRHPITNKDIQTLISELPNDQTILHMQEEDKIADKIR
ncbi:MAG: 2-amino-4-hydroxy-6-hydroxymethyldihydropteridine diphosphokinase [Alphaproteobacteria bacterium]|nr:2-amino-4-hydroxy-6-hydroxymethyldihydropteridine diphosphokinase [Alphaproteobacteria bacterium]